MPAVVLVAVVAAAAAGCTEMSWQRPGTDAQTAEADRAECQRIALMQSARLNSVPLFVPYFVTARDNRGRVRNIPVVPFQQFGPPVWWPYAPSLAMDQQSLKYELFQDCLEAKGYALQPVEAETGAAGEPDATTGTAGQVERTTGGAGQMDQTTGGAGQPDQMPPGDAGPPETPHGAEAPAAAPPPL